MEQYRYDNAYSNGIAYDSEPQSQAYGRTQGGGAAFGGVIGGSTERAYGGGMQQGAYGH